MHPSLPDNHEAELGQPRQAHPGDGRHAASNSAFENNHGIARLSMLRLLMQPQSGDHVLELSRPGYSFTLAPSEDTYHLLAAQQHTFMAENRLIDYKLVHHVMATEEEVLPFTPRSFDYIVIAPDFFDQATSNNIEFQKKLTSLLDELQPLLNTNGRLVCTLKNQWSYRNFYDLFSKNSGSLSYYGYQKALKNCGFKYADFFSLGQGANTLTQLGPKWQQSTLLDTTTIKMGIKDRLKTGLLAPQFIFSASPDSSTQSYPFKHTHRTIRQALNKQFGSGSLQVKSHTLSRKEKIVYIANWGSKKLIIKTPFSHAACASESNNFRCLQQLSKMSGLTTITPQPIAANNSNSGRFFIESALFGTSLAHGLKKSLGERKLFSAASEILKDLFRHSEESHPRLSQQDIYSSHIQEKIDRLYQYTSDLTLKARLQEYFSQALEGTKIPLGICHGDFSVNNILLDQQGKPGLIDWETANMDGLPVLDAINFLDSYFRFINKSSRVNQSIPTLASGQLPGQLAEHFMTDIYRLYDINPQHHQALVYLRWLNHASYLIQFWLRFDRKAQETYIYDIAKTLPNN